MFSPEDIKNLTQVHTSTYNALAEEYNKRAQALAAVTQHATDWMMEHLRPGGKILDLGCGVGLASHFFIEEGFEVFGLDISPTMISFAQQRAPDATFCQEDFLTAQFPSPFDGVFAFAFIHLFPKKIAVDILNKIHSILRDDGIAHISSTRSSVSKEGWETKKDYPGNSIRYRKHWTMDELEESLNKTGFDIIGSKSYSDPFGKPWIDFLVKKS